MVKLNINKIDEYNLDNPLKEYIKFLYNFSNRFQLNYMEINPLVISNYNFIPLDFAVYFDGKESHSYRFVKK